MDVLVLSGGQGRRLEQSRKRILSSLLPALQKYDGQEGPKGLATLHMCDVHRPLIDWHLSIYKATSGSIERVFLGLGFASQMIVDYYQAQGNLFAKMPIFCLQERHPAGTIAGLIFLKKQYGFYPNRPLILANGDNLINFDFGDALEKIKENPLYKEKGIENLVFNIVVAMPHEKSHNYGVVELDKSGHFAKGFHEKQDIKLNPYVRVNGEKKSYINTGFSIIMNPEKILAKYLSSDVADLVEKLEAGELDYKVHENLVKYETMYAQIAKNGELGVIKYEGFWADSGTEAQMLEIELACRMNKGLKTSP
ncbi:MAG: nucleotidyltransferase family protein [Spirochaetia bacterium]